MKKTNLFLITFICFIAFSGFEIYENKGFHYSSGPDPGHSGDAASNFQTCISCHSGSPVREMNSIITSDIPTSGYVPNETYTISVELSEPNIKKYGFQISPQNLDGKFLGEIVITDPLSTQLNTSNEHYINHTFDGNSFPDGIGKWSFQWIAPEKGSGEVIFYGAFLLADNSSTPVGDMVAKSSLTVMESSPNGVMLSDIRKNTLKMKIITKEVIDELQFEFELKKSSDILYSILHANGKIIFSGVYENLGSKKHEKILPVSQLEHGMYILQINADGETSSSRFIK